MKKYKRPIWIVIEVLLSVVVLTALVRNVPFHESLEYVKQWNIPILLLAMLVALIAILIRGGKWKLILQPLNLISFPDAVYATNVALMLNAVLPARPGDLFKAMYAAKTTSSPLSTSLAAIVCERLLDIAVLYGMFLIAFVFLRNKLIGDIDIMGTEISLQTLVRSFDIFAIILLLGLCVILFLNLHFARHIVARLRCRTRPGLVHRFLELTFSFMWSIRKIVQAFANPYYFVSVLIFSLLPWLLFCLSVYLVAIGGPVGKISIFKTMFITAMSLTAVQLPSAPGGWGLFETGVIIALMSTTKISPTVAIPFAVITHLTQYLPVIAAGLITNTIILAKKNRKLLYETAGENK